MKKIIITIFLALPLVCLAQNQGSLVAIINVKDEIKIEENLEFIYTLKSNIKQDLQYIPKIECSNAPTAPLEIKDVSLKANQEYKDKYFSMKVDDIFEPQDCVAKIEITKPFNKIFEKKFKITTNPSLSVDVKLCKEEECIGKSQVFRTGETVYLSIDTGKVASVASATIVDPEKSEKIVSIPGSYEFFKKGIYSVVVTTTADGYKKNTQSFPITVLAEDVKVNDNRICKVDGQCNSQETIQNCLQDCIGNNIVKENFFEKNKNRIIIAGLLVIFVLVMIVSIFLLKKKKNSNNDNIDYSQPNK